MIISESLQGDMKLLQPAMSDSSSAVLMASNMHQKWQCKISLVS